MNLAGSIARRTGLSAAVAGLSVKNNTAKVAKKPPSIVIAEDAEVPALYLRTKVTTEPDKAALKAAILGGAHVPGVSLVAGTRLALK